MYNNDNQNEGCADTVENETTISGFPWAKNNGEETAL